MKTNSKKTLRGILLLVIGMALIAWTPKPAMADEIVWEYSGLNNPKDADRLSNGNILISDYMNHRVIEVDSAGNIVWEYSSVGIEGLSDAERLTNGNTLIAAMNSHRVIEVDSEGNIVWEYSIGLYRPVNVERLSNGNTLISDAWNHRVIEVDPACNIVWEYSTGLNRPFNSQRLSNGNTLISDAWNNRVIEVDPAGNIVWEYSTGLYRPFDAGRLLNGNTLITDSLNDRVIEIDPAGNIVWEYNTGLDCPADADRLSNGNTLITDSYNNRVIEVGTPPATSLILPEYAEGCPGDAVSIPINLDNPDAWEIEGIDMVITFDETVIDATGATLAGGVLEGLGYEIVFDTTVDGQVGIVIYATADLFSGSGDIAFLEFDVVGAEEDDTDLTFTFGEINETEVELSDGYFNVIPCVYNISGFIGYFSDDAPVPNADVDFTEVDYTATTDEFGEYLFEDIPGGNYVSTPSKAEDLGGLSGLDASRIARFAAGLYTLNCLEMIAGDVSMNGEISGMDASRVARYAVGNITELNDDGIEWVFTPEPIPDCADWPPIVYENTREYTPLESDLVDEDFIGIRLGDVSGNWSPDSRAILSSESFETTNIETDINSTLRIPVVIDNMTAIEGIDISIAFNKEVLTLKGLTLNEGILAENDYAVESNLKDGKIVIYAQKELVSGVGVFAFMDFDVIGEVGTSSDIYLTQFDVNETEASGGFNVVDSENETVTRRLQIDVGQTLLEKFVLYPNNPNPFSTRTLIQYDLPKDTHVNIQVYNVKGQLIEELVNGIESAGRKQIEWNAKDRNSGIYFYRLSTEDKTIIKKMILMR